MLHSKKADWRIIHTVVSIIIAILIALLIISILIISWGGLATAESKAKASLTDMQSAYNQLGKISPVEVIKAPMPLIGAEDIMCEDFAVYLSKGYQISSDGKEVTVYNLTKNGTRDTVLRKFITAKPVCCPESMDKELKCCPKLAREDDKTVCAEKHYCTNELVIGGYRRITGKFCMCTTPFTEWILIFPKGFGVCAPKI